MALTTAIPAQERTTPIAVLALVVTAQVQQVALASMTIPIAPMRQAARGLR